MFTVFVAGFYQLFFVRLLGYVRSSCNLALLLFSPHYHWFEDRTLTAVLLSASGYLPQLFGEMDVSGGNTPQPLGESGAPVEQSHPDPARRGSSAGSLHEQQAFSGAYAVQEVYESGLQHDSFTSNDQSSYTHTPPQPEQYVADNGSYSPSSTISARSQSAANPEGVGKHSHSPPMPQHSSSSELMYALHPSNPTEVRF